MPVKFGSSPILPGLSPVCGRSIVARFDGGTMSSDGGLLALREIEQRLAIAQRLDYTLGEAPTATLRKHITDLEQSTAARATATADGQKLRRFKVFHDGAASWDHVERIVARVDKVDPSRWTGIGVS